MRRGRSLRLRIMAAVAVGLTAVIVLLGVTGLQVLQESKRRLLEERLITAGALAQRLDDALQAAAEHLAELSALPDLHTVAIRPDDLEQWDALAARVPLFSHGLYLLDARGAVQNAGGRFRAELGADLSAFPPVREVLAGGPMAISGLMYTSTGRTPVVLLCVRARPGALCGASDLTALSLDRFISGVRLGRTGHAVVVDARGMILASTDPEDRFGADEHPDFHVRLIAGRRAEVGSAAYYKGSVPVEPHIMAFSPSRVAPWGVSFGQTEAETLAPVARTRARMLGVGLLALLAALLFAWWDTGSVTRPLRRLASQATRIAGGDLSGEVPAARGDEVGELAESFEIMRTRLRELVGDLTRREAESQALFEVSREVLGRPQLEGVLQSIAGHARHLLGADTAVICLAGSRWGGRPAAVSGPAEAVEPGAPPTPLCAHDDAMHPAPGQGCPVLRPGFRRSHVVAPLTLDGQTQGALCVGTRGEGRFDTRASELLTSLANLAAIALRSADLREQLQYLAVVEERERIGRDLHDSTLQSLFGIGLALESARSVLAADPRAASARLDQSLAAMSRVAGEIRGFTQGLRQSGPDDRPLVQALAALADEVSAVGIMAVSLSVQEGTPDLPAADRAHLLLIVREALANAIRHGGADRAEVRLEADAEALRVQVHDNGCGFDPSAARARGQGLGNMAARAEQLGGRLTIDSGKDRGTRLTVVVPRGDVKEGGSGGDRASAPARR